MIEHADTLITDAVARLFADIGDAQRLRAEAGEFDAGLWQRIVEGGFHTLLAGKESGGYGLGWSDAYPVLRGLGYWQVPLPLAETLVAALLASLANFERTDEPMTLIQQEAPDSLRVEGPDAAPLLSGRATRVSWGRHAATAIVGLHDGRLALLDLGSRNHIAIRHGTDLAGLPSDTLEFNKAPISRIAANPFALKDPVRVLGAVARSAMIVGALESALERTVSYANDRVQFGKSIGRNQAIQQQLALMASDTAAARVAVLVALSDAPSAEKSDAAAAYFSAAVAKVRSGEAATRGAATAHHVHGAIGFTREYSLNFASRRLWAWRDDFGTPAYWAGELGRLAIQAGGEGFWPALTAKQFSAAPAAASLHR